MDLTILFMMGLVAGTAVGLITSGRKRKNRSRPSIRRKSSMKTKSRVYLQKTRKTDTKPFVGSQIPSPILSQKTIIGQPSKRQVLPMLARSITVQKTLDRQATPGLTDQTKVLAFSACPSCGLEASDLLMSEHFLGSPSHRFGRRESVQELAEITSPHEEKPLTAEEHSSGVMRNLLSMLAPPRAFGRRHMRQNENPFSELIQQRMQAGHSPVPKALPLDN